FRATCKIPSPHLAVAAVCRRTLLPLDERQVLVFDKSLQRHCAFRSMSSVVERLKVLFCKPLNRFLAAKCTFRNNQLFAVLDAVRLTGVRQDSVVVPQIPIPPTAKYVAILMASPAHLPSFVWARLSPLVFIPTIRRHIQASNSGPSQRNLTYLPKRTCGIGSAERPRT